MRLTVGETATETSFTAQQSKGERELEVRKYTGDNTIGPRSSRETVGHLHG